MQLAHISLLGRTGDHSSWLFQLHLSPLILSLLSQVFTLSSIAYGPPTRKQMENRRSRDSEKSATKKENANRAPKSGREKTSEQQVLVCYIHYCEGATVSVAGMHQWMQLLFVIPAATLHAQENDQPELSRMPFFSFLVHVRLKLIGHRYSWDMGHHWESCVVSDLNLTVPSILHLLYMLPLRISPCSTIRF